MDLKEIGINTRIHVDLAKDIDCWRELLNTILTIRALYAMELVSEIFSIYNEVNMEMI